jgi:ADP-ribosyl-[dinitrogen reductase] hydrolase
MAHVARARGCLMGLAVGDAFGGRYEFQESPTVIKNMDADYSGKIRLVPILGGGYHRLNAGQITDDTEMAMCLASAIVQNGGYSEDIAAKNYVEWLMSRPVDAGNATRKALTVDPHKTPSLYGYAQSLTSNAASHNRVSLSNGSMMRISPLSIHGSCMPEEPFLRAVEADCCLTHPNPLVVDACRVYANCVRTAVITGDRDQVLRTANRTAKTQAVSSIIRDAVQKERPFCFYNTEDSEPECVEADDARMGYFGIALHCALFEVANGHSFERSLERVVSKGGDTDTNGCITGALLGALYGISAIPDEWKSTVMNGTQRSGYPLGSHLIYMADALIGATDHREEPEDDASDG